VKENEHYSTPRFPDSIGGEAAQPRRGQGHRRHIAKLPEMCRGPADISTDIEIFDALFE
jgi:hypothetical protein